MGFEMGKVEHKYIESNGAKLHVAEIGTGSTAVMFLHGFPEIWYTWRHQMIAVANAGFRAIATDFRGYGLSDPPPDPEKASYLDIISDLIALLDALGIPKVVRLFEFINVIFHMFVKFWWVVIIWNY